MMRACVHCGVMLEGNEIFLGVCDRCWPKDKIISSNRAKKKKTPPPQEESPVTVSSKAPEPPSAAPAQKKILLIDDEPVLVRLLTTRLQSVGYKVVTAEDGKSGLEKIKSEKPDLIISDILMPEMTGYDLLQKLKREKIAARSIPVIIITAKGDLEKYFSQWEIHGFLTKPIDPVRLLQKVHALLKSGEPPENQG